MARQITIEFLGNDRGLRSAVDSAESRTSKFGATLKKVGAAAALGLAGGAVVAGKALFDMTKGAIEDQAAAEKLATTLKNTTGATDQQVASVENWISKMGVAYGVADDDLRPALSRLAAATHDVGKAQDLTRLAMDVSAGTGKSLESVTTALAKAQNGSVGGLARLGVATKDAAGHTLTMEQITRKLADTYRGQASKQADTLQGKMTRLRLILSETGEAIGYKLIPVVTKMADWFLKRALPAISKFGGWMHDHLGPVFKQVQGIISRATAGMHGDVGRNFAAIRDIVRSVTSIIRSLWSRFGKYLVQYAVSTFKNVRQIIGGALKVIQGIFKVWSSLLKGDWRGVWTGIKQIVSGAWSVIKGVVKQGFNVLRLLFKVGWSALKGIVSGAWDGIKTLVRNGAGALVDAVRAVPGKIAGIARGMFDSIKSAFRSAINYVIGAWNGLQFTIPGVSIKGHQIFGGTSIGTPNIPYLAKGGVVKARPGGTLALLGEGGRDEAVVPLPRAGRAAVGGMELHVHFHQPVAGDPRAFARAVRTELLKEKRLLGAPLGLA
ncbi:MAG: hypothetical protein HOQ45_02395 [Nocardioidaceae bacterium]|nr:hypothetical protein [Dermatophilaceae bacterium]NUR05844.1 hypothetical protein [Nocardioidaceae bacterium]